MAVLSVDDQATIELQLVFAKLTAGSNGTAIMDHDDAPVGRVLTRREVLGLFGGLGVVALVGACADDDTPPAAPSPAGATVATTGATATTGGTIASPAATAATAAAPALATATALHACVVVPALTEGPYFVDERLERSDIRVDEDGSVKDGVPLALTFNVSQIGTAGCVPLAAAMVDIWQCDALGVYSGVSDPDFTTAGETFLRGYQPTGTAGGASFVTVYPGWYPGRTVHIHFKIRANDTAGRALEFTSQLFFDDALSDEVFTREPYSTKGERNARNANDGIYNRAGDQLLLTLTPDGDGYAATFDVGLQIT